MHRLLPSLAALILLAGPAIAQNAPPANSGTSAQDNARALEEFRADVQAKRSDVLAKNISLSAAEAAKFWPLYEKFQAEQNVIVDAQLKGIQEYAANYDKLDDAKALAFIDVQLKRDEAMAALRRKWLPQFQKVVSTPTAVRVMQIDRRLSQAMQVALSARIPLVR